MVLSFAFAYALATLPLRLIVLSVQYFTIGTNFTHAEIKRSLRKTLICGINQHIGRGLTGIESKYIANYTVASKLKQHSSRNGDLPNYGEVYTEVNPDIDEYQCASSWLTKIDNRSHDDPVLVYFHGGCFALQIMDSSVEGLANIYRVLDRDHGKKVSILVVDYTLSQVKNYPQQINEASYIYDKLVNEGNTNISLIGESAGGQLSINVLQHLLEQKRAHGPEVVWPRAVVTISPYLNVSRNEYKGSLKNNDKFDTFPYNMVERFGAIYTGNDKSLDESAAINTEANSDKTDWNSIPTIKEGKILVVFGDREILSDQILRWCSKIGLTERYPERIALEINGTHNSVFAVESADYKNLESWKQSYSASSILSFLNQTI